MNRDRPHHPHHVERLEYFGLLRIEIRKIYHMIWSIPYDGDNNFKIRSCEFNCYRLKDNRRMVCS